jgi:hypothetical protein
MAETHVLLLKIREKLNMLLDSSLQYEDIQADMINHPECVGLVGKHKTTMCGVCWNTE